RLLPLAAAVVHVGDLVLDRATFGGLRVGERRGVARDRFRVIAVQGVEVADALVDACRGGPRRGLRIASLDRVTQGARLRMPRDAELAVQRQRALAVLPQRGRALAGARVQAHERAMRGL